MTDYADNEQPTTQIWEQWEGEPDTWFTRFDVYRLLGPLRTIEAAWKQINTSGIRKGKRPSKFWYSYAKEFEWKKRAEAWDQHLRDEQEKRWNDSIMGKSEILARWSEQARANINEFVEIDAKTGQIVNLNDDALMVNGNLVKSIKTSNGRTNSIGIELHDHQKALDKLYKAQGFDKPEEVTESMAYNCEIPAVAVGPKFFDFLRAIESSKYSEFLATGGRGSLKSSTISLAIVKLLVNNPNMHAFVTRQMAKTIGVSVYPQLLWAFDKLGYSNMIHATTSPYRIIFEPTGQRIIFDGASDESAFKSIKLPFGYIGIGWFEELDQFRGAAAVRKIEQSIFRGGDRYFNFKSFNPPPTQMNWANQYWNEEKAGQFKHFSNYLDTPRDWLGDFFFDEAEHLKKTNPRAYEHEYMGVVTGLGGMVFENLEEREITKEEIMQFDHVGHGLDWGWFPDPLAWTKSHYDYTRHILYIFDEYVTLKTKNFDAWNYLHNEKGVQFDDLIIADSEDNKSIADFREYGSNCIGAEKGPGSVDYSYKWLQSLFKIVIDKKRCPVTWKEFSQAEYQQDSDGNYISAYPEDDNHCIDSVRYRTNPIWRKRGK